MNNKSELVNNLAWKFAERFTAQIVTTIVGIVLARLLEPEHYGIIAMVEIFITIANVFVSDGFGSALIQKKDADELDFSTVFYFNIMFSVLIYMLLFYGAPYIAGFYGKGYEKITKIIRVLGLRLILCSVNSVQQAYVSKNMIFRKFFFATLLGTIISAVVGIVMAYTGFGVWALVAQYLTNTTVDTIVLNRTLKFRPKLRFSIKRLKILIPFGIRILVSRLLITGYQELRALIIGRIYTSSDLAYYNKGRQFPKLIVNNIDASISAVLFPKMSQEQDNLKKIKTTMKKSIRFSSYIMSPMMLGLAAIAEPFVKLVLTEKWISCVFLLQVFCVIYLFQPIHTANMQAIKAVGRSDIYLKIEIIKKILELITLLLVMRISINAITISMAILTSLFTFVNAYPNKKLFGYSFKEEMLDILPNIIMALIMSSVVFYMNCLKINVILLMILQILIGIGIYIMLSVLTKNREFKYLLKMIIEIFAKIRKRG